MYLYFSFKIIISRKITYFILFISKIVVDTGKKWQKYFFGNYFLKKKHSSQSLPAAANNSFCIQFSTKIVPTLQVLLYIYVWQLRRVLCQESQDNNIYLSIFTGVEMSLTEWFNRKSFGNFNALRISSHSIRYWAISCGCYSNLKY